MDRIKQSPHGTLMEKTVKKKLLHALKRLRVLVYVSAQMSCLCMLTGIDICMYITCIYDMHMYDIYISIYAFTQGF